MIQLKTTLNTNISKFVYLSVTREENRVENIDFVISKKILDKVTLELIKEAFRNAEQKANILAFEGNFTISGIKQIDTSSNGGYYPPSYSLNDYGSATAETIPTPSTQIIPQKKVTVTLPVIFYINNHTN
ncbi:MAG TPA: SIMPL domain-containing protein [Candidatus Saccharimonadales bacterium]|nr:SIMPL domain-containing protein [Candidatus Saccharimonadales bacterium]